ncbi:MAG: energy-coupling factor transporter transmembrane component T [Pseudomonadota bacterium]
MKNDILLGGYIPSDSFLHRLDPRTKLVGLVAFLAAVFWSPVASGVAVAALPAAILAGLSRTGWKIWFLAFRRFALMLAVVPALNVFFNTQGTPVVVLQRELPFTWEGLETGFVFTSQIALAIVSALVLTFTTSPADLSRALELFLRPLKRFKVPVEDLGMILLLAMRFVPLLQQELYATMDAQKSRGVEFSRGSLSTRAGNLVALLSPVMTGALRRADLLALAMTARGFRPGGTRTQFRPLEFRSADGLAFCAILLFTAGRLALLP